MTDMTLANLLTLLETGYKVKQLGGDGGFQVCTPSGSVVGIITAPSAWPVGDFTPSEMEGDGE